MTDDNQQNLEAIIGRSAKYSEHKAGEVVSFRTRDGQKKQGTIVHVRAPGQQGFVGGEAHGMLYVVDTGEGFPMIIAPGEVIQDESDAPGDVVE